MTSQKVIRVLIEFGFALMGSIVGGIAADRWLQAQENEARYSAAARAWAPSTMGKGPDNA